MLRQNSSKNNVLLFIPFVALFVIIFIMNNGWIYAIDDVFFRNQILTNGLDQIFNILQFRYMEWSSRSLIELFMYLFIYLPMIVWKVLNALIVTLIAVIIPRFFDNENSLKKNILSSICVFLFFIPVFSAMGAGAIAVSLNYLWPLFFFVAHFYLLKRYIFNKTELKLWKKVMVYFALVFSLLFSCNHEQSLIIFGIIYLLIIGYSYCKYRKINRTLILLFILVICSGLFIISCPGNSVRMASEIAMWWPSFGSLSVLNKINMGICSFFRIFVSGNVLICLVFLFAFGLYNYIISEKNKLVGFITFIPFIIAIIINCCLLFNVSPVLTNFINDISSYSLISNSMSLLFSFIYLIITVSIFYGLYNIRKIKGNKTFSIIFILLAIGFITTLIIGFTPTMLISISRMYVMLYGSLAVLSYYLIKDLL